MLICVLTRLLFFPSSSDLQGGGASVVVVAGLYPESAERKDLCPAKGTISPQDLFLDQGVVPDLMTGNKPHDKKPRHRSDVFQL